jgi:hypothetical protein
MAKRSKPAPKPPPAAAEAAERPVITPEQGRQLADIYRTFRRYYGQQARKKKLRGRRWEPSVIQS